MAISEEMYRALRAEWLKIEGGDPAFAGPYPAMEWVMHPAALADLQVEDDRGVATQGFMLPQRDGFEFMGLPIRVDVSVERWRLDRV